MCDTIVALGNSTRNGDVIFAKNSDREPNEAHQLIIIPEKSHDCRQNVRCTYIEIPQEKKTRRVLLAKPFWIWGAEMGVNEDGVAIGNEAIFTKEIKNKEPGLIGMDFIRLALERADNAYRALEVITSLIEKYGQSGNCGYSHPFYYQNSFLIADRVEAWVLETINRQWAAIQVKDFYAISNAYTIQEEWDIASNGLIDYARTRGWLKKGQVFNFKECFSDRIYTKFSDAERRRSVVVNQLRRHNGNLTAKSMTRILSTHHDDEGNGQWRPDQRLAGQDICMHAGFGPVRINQTVGSMISTLDQSKDTHFLTGTSSPCISVFKPVWLDTGLPDVGHQPGAKYDPAQLWWRHEKFQREMIKNYPEWITDFHCDRKNLQEEIFQDENHIKGKADYDRSSFSKYCFNQVDECYQKWNKIFEANTENKTSFYYQWFWNKMNRDAGIPI